MDVLSIFMQGNQREWKLESFKQPMHQTGFQTLLKENQTMNADLQESLETKEVSTGALTVNTTEVPFIEDLLADCKQTREVKTRSVISSGKMEQLVKRIEDLPFEYQLELLAYLKRMIADQLSLLLTDGEQDEQQIMEKMIHIQSLLASSNLESFEKALDKLLLVIAEEYPDVAEEIDLFQAMMTSDDLQVANQFLVQLEGVAADLQSVLSDLASGGIDYKRQAGVYLQLLKSWSKMTEGPVNKLAELTLTDKLTDKERVIFEQTLQVFEKRNHFKTSNMYQNDATITKQDIAHWLEQALTRYEQSDQSFVTQPTSSFRALQSEIAQYDIHVNTLQKVEKVNTEMVEKLVDVVKDSKFLSSSNLQQISLQLRPENLGNIIVRLTQTDGEMVVKIIVATDAARKALEANTYQLKQVFSPHQITIEKNELMIEEEFHLEEHEQEKEEQEKEQTKQRAKKEEHEDSKESFIAFLQRLEKGA